MSRDDYSSEGVVRPTVSSPDARHRSGSLSLENVHSSVDVPHSQASFWEQWRAFVGPAILVSVGYMDPGNWGTDLQGGAQYKYGLLWVVGLASLMAIFMQVVSARLGVVTGKDLAQCCRDWYPAWTRWPNWLLSELAIGACDLAEVIGSAIALNLLFGIPLVAGVLLTAADVLVVLFLQNRGFRYVESLVAGLIILIGACFMYELIVSQPPIAAMLGDQSSFSPSHFWIAMQFIQHNPENRRIVVTSAGVFTFPQATSEAPRAKSTPTAASLCNRRTLECTSAK